MKNISIIALATIAIITLAFRQHSGGVYKTNTGNISFFSHTPVEDIAAENHKVKTAISYVSNKIGDDELDTYFQKYQKLDKEKKEDSVAISQLFIYFTILID